MLKLSIKKEYIFMYIEMFPAYMIGLVKKSLV